MKQISIFGIILVAIVISGCSNPFSKSDENISPISGEVNTGIVSQEIVETIPSPSGDQVEVAIPTNTVVSGNIYSGNNTESEIPEPQNFDFGKVEIPSPVYSFKQETPKGTVKIKIILSGDTSGGYFLKKFNPEEKTFTANFRLDYENIRYGTNEYTIEFYGSEYMIGRGKFIIDTFFQEIVLGEHILYFDEENFTDYQNKGNIYVSDIYNILIKSNNIEREHKSWFIYNQEKQLLFQVKNVTNSPLGEVSKGNIYDYDGNLLAKGIDFSIGSSGGPQFMTFDYNHETKDIIIDLEGTDMCSSYRSKTIYNGNNKKVVSKYIHENNPMVKDYLLIRHINQQLEIFIDYKEVPNTEKSKFLGLKYRYSKEIDNKRVKEKEGYIIKEDKIINTSTGDEDGLDCGYFISFSHTIDYTGQRLSIELEGQKFVRDLDNLSHYEPLL